MRFPPILLVAFALIFLVQPNALAGSGNIILTPREAYEQSESGDRIIVDIRRPSEWAATGVAKPARTVTMHQKKGPRGFLEALMKLVEGDLNRPIALICASGSRSTWAQKFLTAHGFTDVANIKAGMLGRGPDTGWIAQDLPIRSCESCNQQ